MSTKHTSVRLTDLTNRPGARVKYPYASVERILAQAGVLQAFPHIAQGEDAFLCELDDSLQAALAIECLTPFTTDLRIFGASVATSVIDRILAVGAHPCAALNLLSFPCSMDALQIGSMLASAQEVLSAHNATVVGGHTVDDREPKFGIFAFGLVDPQQPTYSLAGAHAGDALVITKPLGAQLLCAYHNQGELADEFLDAAATNMATSAQLFAQHFETYNVHACACIGAGGLLSAVERMADHATSPVKTQIDAGRLPLLAGVIECAFDHAQRLSDQDRQGKSLEALALQTILEDPAIAGGLVMAMTKQDALRMTSTIGGRMIGTFDLA